MKRGKDDWLDQIITEELIAMADEREKELMEMEELQGIDMPFEKFEDVKREAMRRRKQNRRRILRPRIAVAVAAVLALLLGLGAIGSREYEPEIREYASGDETTTRIENSDSEFREYSEEEVCREIEEKLGVLAPRLVYRPEGMILTDYWIDVGLGEAVIIYERNKTELKVYVSKDYVDTSINFEMDDEAIETATIEAIGIAVPIYECTDIEDNKYYQSEFKMFNTYYSVMGMMELKEYIEIFENISTNNI